MPQEKFSLYAKTLQGLVCYFRFKFESQAPPLVHFMLDSDFAEKKKRKGSFLACLLKCAGFISFPSFYWTAISLFPFLFRKFFLISKSAKLFDVLHVRCWTHGLEIN
jgi:hypothetical protein